jgi:hypothetical protein
MIKDRWKIHIQHRMAQSSSSSSSNKDNNNEQCTHTNSINEIFNQEHRHVKNAKGKESHAWRYVFVWHAAMLVVVIPLLVCTGQNTIGKKVTP